jgi:FdhD protein
MGSDGHSGSGEGGEERPAMTRRIGLLRVGRNAEPAEDIVAEESPLEIRVEGRPVAVVMRTPGHDEELAAGFLLSEGVIASPDDVFEISTCPSQADGGRAVDVLLARPESVDFDRLTRHVFSASSCGICGKAATDAVLQHFPPLPRDGLRVPARMILSLPEKLRAAQPTFDATGGLHASALFDLGGTLVTLREDVGRHNALDKVLGDAFFRRRLPLDRHILVLSGRVSFELMQKALAARIPIVAAISAPSSLAISFAESGGQTLCGFVRGERMNVYAHPGRIDAPAV